MSDKEKFLEFLDSVPAHQRLYPDLYADQLIDAGATFKDSCVTETPPVGCKFCRPVDQGGMCWQFDDGITLELRAGKLTLTTASGDDVIIPIPCCPICGASIESEEGVMVCD